MQVTAEPKPSWGVEQKGGVAMLYVSTAQAVIRPDTGRTCLVLGLLSPLLGLLGARKPGSGTSPDSSPRFGDANFAEDMLPDRGSPYSRGARQRRAEREKLAP